MTVATPGILVEIETAKELGFPQGIQNSHLAHLSKAIPGNIQKLNRDRKYKIFKFMRAMTAQQPHLECSDPHLKAISHHETISPNISNVRRKVIFRTSKSTALTEILSSQEKVITRTNSNYPTNKIGDLTCNVASTPRKARGSTVVKAQP